MELIYKCYKCDDVNPCVFRTDDIGQEPAYCPVLGKAEWELKKSNYIIFENVSSNIIHSRVTGEKQLIELTLPITAENEKQCLEAYIKTGKLKVIIEVME